MATSKSMPSADPTKDLVALFAAVAAEPDLSKGLAELKAASDRYDHIREKINERPDHKGRIAKARSTVNALAARVEIGKATPEDLETAKTELADARESLELAPGRRQVMVDELETARDEMLAAEDRLKHGLSEWRSGVRVALRAIEKSAVQSLYAAGQAFDLIYPDQPSNPSIAAFTHDLPGYHGNWAAGEQFDALPFPVAPQIQRAISLIAACERKAEYVPDYNSFEASRATEADRAVANLITGKDSPVAPTITPIVEMGYQIDRQRPSID